MKTLAIRRRSIGLAVGALWLIAISLVFIVWSLLVIRTTMATVVLIGTCVLLGAFVAAGVVVIRVAVGLPDSTVPRSPEEKKIWRRFALVVSAEVIAFSVINAILGATKNYELMPSLNLIVVGIHFFPLAWIFRVPRYHISGLLFCVIPAVTLLAIPKQFAIGYALAWYVWDADLLLR